MAHTKNDQLMVYKSDQHSAAIEVFYREDTLWLSQKQMAQLFEKNSEKKKV